MRRLPRIPIPVRLFLSYMLVVALGAVPTFVYLGAETLDRLTMDTAQQLAARAQRIETVIVNLPRPQRLERLKQYAELSTERLTYITQSGVVLFDSEAAAQQMDNHLARPEVQMALGKLDPDTEDLELKLPGTGAARRISVTTNHEALYVALLLGPTPNREQDILRVAGRASQIREVTDATLDFARNSQAVAVSIAIGLSLLSAALFTRPLQRVANAASALAEGDYSIQLDRIGDDEIGDVARALERLASQLRTRLASARAGEAMLTQLAEALPVGLLVLEPDGEVVSINGRGRRWLQLERCEVGERLPYLVSQPAFQKALATAEHEGEPEPVTLAVGGAGEATVQALLHVLKRPGIPPLCALLNPEREHGGALLTPDPRLVTPRPLSDLLNASRQRAEALLRAPGVKLSVPATLPTVAVADLQERLLWGSVLVFLFGALSPNASGDVPMTLEIEPTTVRMELDLALEPGLLTLLRAMWEPLGGRVQETAGKLTLWMPRA